MCTLLDPDFEDDDIFLEDDFEIIEDEDDEGEELTLIMHDLKLGHWDPDTNFNPYWE